MGSGLAVVSYFFYISNLCRNYWGGFDMKNIIEFLIFIFGILTSPLWAILAIIILLNPPKRVNYEQ